MDLSNATPAEVHMWRVRRMTPAPLDAERNRLGSGTKFDATVMKKYFDLGLTGAEIVECMRIEHGVIVTRQGVSYWKSIHGPGPRERNPHQADLIPWPVRTPHQSGRLLRALRAEAAMRNGEIPDQRDLNRWRSVLAERRVKGGLVIDYDREAGFFLTEPRRKPDGSLLDDDWIRDPRIADDGRWLGPLRGKHIARLE